LIEIPGEESVTDPGVVAAPSPAVLAEAPSSGIRMGVLGALGFALVIGGVWWSTLFEPESEAPTVVVKTGSPIPLSAHEDQPLAVEADAPAVAETAAASGSKRGSGARTKYVKSRAQPPDLSAAPARDASVLPAGTVAGLGSAPADVFSTIGAAPRSRSQKSIVLKDSLRIEEMIGRVLTRGAKQLEQCYSQALKMNEGLKGAWYVDFTITPEGKPIAVSVEALAGSNAGIEQCISRNVTRWRFQRVSEPVDVARTYRFGG
jgi:hypothetical protein